jgi:hypothetical protein
VGTQVIAIRPRPELGLGRSFAFQRRSPQETSFHIANGTLTCELPFVLFT